MDQEWTYEQSTGKLYDSSNKHVATGYSGNGTHINKADSQGVKSKGPLPRGTYTMNEPRKSDKTGAYAMDLTPSPENNMEGRDSFQIHGDNSKGDKSASEGCIILSRDIREKMWTSNIHKLKVVDKVSQAKSAEQ
ncbi:hypothetical protein DICPUDRAFT_97622 [Dictyostelium purpureum]|uniref:Tlde1 domain-containing protein n=1 Tax=Dictyostelium purpureum TaxID=5786 RepID=F0ZIC9_DICPU|nr:uncharacterized protein DICPUDRAFT_97622 [Dictyostelium purpureum]EGC36285.1 hypothetical protein DICPUDRAFT_97622 [Dictyostelium purpureum]|eukprot:XP_003287163.1 hypothetical protein DICPUDRAFT_97622 [Dictyostelium purpureum]